MKKTLAIVLALCLVLGTVFVLAGCGKDTNEPATEVTETGAPVEETGAPIEETAVEETAAAEETTVEETTVEETTEAAKVPSTTEEIVEYYNTAANKVKTDAKSVKSPYSKISLNGSTVLPSSINGILKLLGGADKFLGDQLSKNGRNSSETYTGSEIDEKFPVEGESYASKLTADDVKSATCEEKDGKYVITIKTKADGKTANVVHGTGHAPKAFNVVLPGVVNDNIPGVAAGIAGTATMDYPTCTLKVVVDPETGNLESGVYDLCWTINFDKIGVILPFLTSTSYEVAY